MGFVTKYLKSFKLIIIAKPLFYFLGTNKTLKKPNTVTGYQQNGPSQCSVDYPALNFTWMSLSDY